MTDQNVIMARDLIEWFSFAARQILEHKIALTQHTVKLLSKYKKELRKLAHPYVDKATKRRIFLRTGGGGYLGGVLIRALLCHQRVIDDRFVTADDEENVTHSQVRLISERVESFASTVSSKDHQRVTQRSQRMRWRMLPERYERHRKTN